MKLLLDDKIRAHEISDEFRIMQTHIETPGGGQIIFRGMKDQTAESIKSLEGFDIAWVEEAQAVSQRSLDLLRPTIRKPGSEIWFSWNPRFETDPVDRLLRNPTEPLPDSIVVKSSYLDNPWFSAELRAEMEWDRRVDPEKWAHIWMGEYERHSEARVFRNWQVKEFETPRTAVLRYGGDWGFSVDPAVGIRMFEMQPTPENVRVMNDPTFTTNSRKRLYFDRECWKIGVEIDHLPTFFDTLDGGWARHWPMRVDSARPETISYMRRHGYPRMGPATKGPNSVKEGVIFLQGYDIYIHPRCRHTIDEFTLYSYKVDPLTGLVLPVLSDKKNHVIDSARYAAEDLRVPQVFMRRAVGAV